MKKLSKKQSLILAIKLHGCCPYYYCRRCKYMTKESQAEGRFQYCGLQADINPDRRYIEAVNRFVHNYGKGALVEILL